MKKKPIKLIPGKTVVVITEKGHGFDYAFLGEIGIYQGGSGVSELPCMIELAKISLCFKCSEITGFQVMLACATNGSESAVMAECIGNECAWYMPDNSCAITNLAYLSALENRNV